ncbi:MAG TPA: hypothetical protein VKA91_07120 [Nitrososphaeraceae archaeon]|nr:hypothetical protein [Nitrososphaeraceae archaeon]
MKSNPAITATGTIANNRTTTSLCLAKYVKNIQQANKRTAGYMANLSLINVCRKCAWQYSGRTHLP